MHQRILTAVVAALSLSASMHADDAAARAQVDKVHAEIWRRFVDPHNLVLDYCDLDGSIIRPTPEDCREMKPSALSWGVPVEDGPMFNGLYLDSLCTQWKLTKDEAIRTKARRLIDGLLLVARIGKTPGFIARGIASDGRTTYPLGSNDQTTPWLYGIWRYLQDGLAQGDERQELTDAFVNMGTILDSHGWKMPTDGPPCAYRGDFMKPGWEGAPRILFALKAMHHLTKDDLWHQRYLAAAQEKSGVNHTPRIEFCRRGMVFDPAQGERHSWTGSEGVVCLRALWEMETDPALRDAYLAGLRSSASLSAKSLPLHTKFDPQNTAHFHHDWRVMNEAWRPQHSEKDAVDVAIAGLRVQHRHSPRLHLEKDWVREPCFAAWVVSLCPDAAHIAPHHAEIREVICHYDCSRLYLSQFFPIESAWWRLQESLALP